MKEYRDEIAMVCHEMMKAGQSVGAVSDAEMQEFEENCFVSVPAPVQNGSAFRETELVGR